MRSNYFSLSLYLWMYVHTHILFFRYIYTYIYIYRANYIYLYTHIYVKTYSLNRLSCAKLHQPVSSSHHRSHFPQTQAWKDWDNSGSMMCLRDKMVMVFFGYHLMIRGSIFLGWWNYMGHIPLCATMRSSPRPGSSKVSARRSWSLAIPAKGCSGNKELRNSYNGIRLKTITGRLVIHIYRHFWIST